MVMMVMIVTTVFEEATAPGDGEPDDEHCGHRHPVVGVEVQLRQKITGRDADEGSGAEGEGVDGESNDVAAGIVDAPDEEQHAERNDQGEETVDQEHAGPRKAFPSHEGDDGE